MMKDLRALGDVQKIFFKGACLSRLEESLEDN
jgi:hypothetical protein